ncbi:hypothetical protein [Microcoleus sp. B3-D7]|uniref:hypothetical protein n=1 Tax=Microcoleus sp. B3-D7 TaxID=2818659 RepID=UPI002FCF5E83
MAKASSLQTKGVFACCCNIHDRTIHCEMLAVSGNQEIEASLLDVETGKRYSVRLPAGAHILWDYTMERVVDVAI